MLSLAQRLVFAHEFTRAISKALPKTAFSFCSDESYTDRWVESTFKGSDAGKFKWSAGKFYNDADLDKGKTFLLICYTFRRNSQQLTLVVQLEAVSFNFVKIVTKKSSSHHANNITAVF